MIKTAPLLTQLDIGEVKLATRVYPGGGTPNLFIHGSLDDHQAWDGVVDALLAEAEHPIPMIVYDRRGHSASTDSPGQGRISQDVADAAALLSYLNVAQAHVVGHSYGANIALSLAQQHPELVASLFLYEPPIFGLLNGTPAYVTALKNAKEVMEEAVGLLEAGEIEKGTALFVEEIAFGGGSWHSVLDERTRACMLANADTWLDQARDPERLEIGIEGLKDQAIETTLCYGNQTLSSFRGVVEVMRERMPSLRTIAIAGAGHGAPISHPTELAAAVQAHLSQIT
ncbi:MAG: alpha/beta hydrolase [Chloroflexota bacterium]